MSFVLHGADDFIRSHTAEHADAYQGPLGTVVDVGAHVGGFALRMAARGAKRVFALEPDPGNFGNLVLNIAQNGMFTVHAAHMAVVHDDVPVTLLYGVDERSSGQKSILYRPQIAQSATTVECIRFDRVLRAHIEAFGFIDVLKVDVEGEEHDLFLKTLGVDKLLDRVRYIDVEIHELDNRDYFDVVGYTPGALQTFLRKHGFEDGAGGDFRSFNKHFRKE